MVQALPCVFITQRWVTVCYLSTWYEQKKKLIWIIQSKCIWVQDSGMKNKNGKPVYVVHKSKRQSYKWQWSPGTTLSPSKSTWVKPYTHSYLYAM